MDKHTAWNNFLHTGRVEDYLLYKSMQSCAGEPEQNRQEDAPPHADYDGWSRSGYC